MSTATIESVTIEEFPMLVATAAASGRTSRT